MVVTWSDEDSEAESENETANVVKALMVKGDVEEDSSDEEISDQEQVETYKLLYTKWTELCDVCEKQKKMILTLNQEKGKIQGNSCNQEQENIIQTLMQEKKKLQIENAELQEEVSLLEAKLESMNKSLRMLNNGTNALDVILEASKKGRSIKGIGFDYSSTNQEGQLSKNKFFVSERSEEHTSELQSH